MVYHFEGEEKCLDVWICKGLELGWVKLEGFGLDGRI